MIPQISLSVKGHEAKSDVFCKNVTFWGKVSDAILPTVKAATETREF